MYTKNVHIMKYVLFRHNKTKNVADVYFRISFPLAVLFFPVSLVVVRKPYKV